MDLAVQIRKKILVEAFKNPFNIFLTFDISSKKNCDIDFYNLTVELVFVKH